MSEENTSAVEQGTGTPIDQIPTDFREYDRWRSTGELPSTEESKPPAAAKESAPEGEPESPATTAPASEPEDSQESEESKRPGSRQRRIDRLTRENADLQRRLEALERRSEPTAPVPPPAEPAPPAGKPDLKDFTTLEDYTEALTEWKLDQRDAKRQAEAQREAAVSAERTLQESWSSKEAAASKAHADYRELIDGTEIPVGPGVLAVRQALLEEDHGAEILYWLASRPTELKRVAALSPHRAVIEVGKIAAALAAPPENPKPKVSSAPRPPAPISHGTTRTADDVYSEDTARDYKRWNRAREAQLKGK